MSFERQIHVSHILQYCFYYVPVKFPCGFQSSLPGITKHNLSVRLCSMERIWTWLQNDLHLILDSHQTISLTFG